jgi:hypothetical protein
MILPFLLRLAKSCSNFTRYRVLVSRQFAPDGLAAASSDRAVEQARFKQS